MFGNLLNVVTDIVNFIKDLYNSISGIFHGVNFNILYNWLPSDIVIVITAVIATLLIISLVKLIKHLLFFLG